MKKLDNYMNCLAVLENAHFDWAREDEIYRMGIVGQFQLTLELAWKALQEILRLHGVLEAETGSPREILKLAYKVGFLDDEAVWLLMLKKRNLSAHVYHEAEIDELMVLIRDSFIPALQKLRITLQEKYQEVTEEE